MGHTLNSETVTRMALSIKHWTISTPE
jgi:hypothetical protein